MFTQTTHTPRRSLARTIGQRVLGSDLLDLLTGPHGVDRYTELVAPTWTLGEPRAKVVAVRRATPRSVTLTLAPNAAFRSRGPVQAGQYVNLTVDIDGRRHSRCYSPANAQGAADLELTIGRHDGGLVSNYLYEHAHRGMVVGLTGVGGDFVLPAQRPRRILFVSGGSGITPVLAMLRTLLAEGYRGELAFVHYARTPEEACYRDELATLAGVRVLHGYTRSADGDLTGRFGPAHWPPRCRRPMRCSSAAQRLWSTPSGRYATTSTPKASCRRPSSRRPTRRAGESPSPTAGST